MAERDPRADSGENLYVVQEVGLEVVQALSKAARLIERSIDDNLDKRESVLHKARLTGKQVRKEDGKLIVYGWGHERISFGVEQLVEGVDGRYVEARDLLLPEDTITVHRNGDELIGIWLIDPVELDLRNPQDANRFSQHPDAE